MVHGQMTYRVAAMVVPFWKDLGQMMDDLFRHAHFRHLVPTEVRQGHPCDLRTKVVQLAWEVRMTGRSGPCEPMVHGLCQTC